MNQLATAGLRSQGRRAISSKGLNGFKTLNLNQRRGYSFFSSKGNGNGGRYFTGNSKPVNGKEGTPVVDSKAGAPAINTKTQQVDGQPSSSPTTVSAADASTDKQETPDTNPQTTLPLPPPHPTLTLRDLQMHQLFSLHRPLLSLYSPSPFHSPSSPSLYSDPLSTSISNTSNTTSSAATVSWEEDSEDNDTDDTRSDSTALHLWHSLVNSKLTPVMSFHSALANLGSTDSKEMQQAISQQVERVKSRRIEADSTKRKRRRKMSKHKLKKRRRLERALRRQQSK